MRSHNKSKGFAFITAPQHVTNELVELNGVQFQGNCLIIEKASPRIKSIVRSNPHSRPHVTSNSSENGNTCPKNKFVLGHVTYADTAKSAKRPFTGHTQNHIVIFGDSITCRIRMRDFNRKLNTGHAKIRTFPGAFQKNFHTMLHLH